MTFVNEAGPHLQLATRSTRRKQRGDVLHQDVGLEVDAVAGPTCAEGRFRERMRDERDGEGRALAGEDGEAHAVDCDRALLDEVAREAAWRLELVELPIGVGADRSQPADAVDVPLDEVTAEPIADAERALEVDARARHERAEGRATERLR